MTSEKTIFYIGVFDKDGVGGWAEEALRFQNIDDESLYRIGIHPNSQDRAEKFSRQNNWAQDRAKMKAGSFAGLHLFIPEDVAVAESAGEIYDRTEENLVPADQVIVRIRRMLLDIARDVQAGRAPLGLREPIETSEIYTLEALSVPGTIGAKSRCLMLSAKNRRKTHDRVICNFANMTSTAAVCIQSSESRRSIAAVIPLVNALSVRVNLQIVTGQFTPIGFEINIFGYGGVTCNGAI